MSTANYLDLGQSIWNNFRTRYQQSSEGSSCRTSRMERLYRPTVLRLGNGMQKHALYLDLDQQLKLC